MTFTVVRAVSGSDLSAGERGERLQRVVQTTPPPPAIMDLPYAEEILQLDLSDFAKTVPGALGADA